MRVVLFCHSLLSDWDHSDAHFLRGVVRELQARGHPVAPYEPRDGRSLAQLRLSEGDLAIREMRRAIPGMNVRCYEARTIDLDAALDGADLVIVHDRSPRRLIDCVGAHRDAGGDYRLLFYDTGFGRSRARSFQDLQDYDGVLACGPALCDAYCRAGWTGRAWTWRRAVDARLFRPLPCPVVDRELVWIGNSGDGEWARELSRFLMQPASGLGLRGRAYGVRYSTAELRRLAGAGIEYRGWLPNHLVPEVYARHRLTVHVPRPQRAGSLPPGPSSRVFEALACGIPLLCAPGDGAGELLNPGEDCLAARNAAEMRAQMRAVLADPGLAAALAQRGRQTVLARHTCAHRVDELLGICAELGLDGDGSRGSPAWFTSESPFESAGAPGAPLAAAR